MVLALSALPPIQRKAAFHVAGILAGHIGSHVHMGGLKLGMGNRLVLDDVQIYDKKDSLMLGVSRIAVKIDLYSLLSKRIHIYNAQIIGAKTHLYQTADGEDLNIKFLIDAFSGKDDSKSSGIDLQAETFIIRRSRLRLDKCHVPEETGKFSASHMDIRDISLTARINRLTRDSINVTLKKLGFKEKSGLCVKRVSLEAKAGRGGGVVKDILLETEKSAILIPVVRITCPVNGDAKWRAKDIYASGDITGDITPGDISPAVPLLANFTGNIHLESSLTYDRGNVSANGISVSDGENTISLYGDCEVRDIFGTPATTFHIRSLDTTDDAQDFLLRNISGNTDKHVAQLDALGSTHTTGTVKYINKGIEADIHTRTDIGEVEASGTIRDMNDINASIYVKDFDTGAMAGKADGPGVLSMRGDITGKIKGAGAKPQITAKGDIEKFVYKNYPHQNIPFSFAMHGKDYSARTEIRDINGNIALDIQTRENAGERSVACKADVDNFSPFNMNLTRKYEKERFGGILDAELTLKDINDIVGEASLKGFAMTSDNSTTVMPGDVLMTSTVDEDGQHVSVSSPFLRVEAKGKFKWKELYASLLNNTYNNLPSLIPAPPAGNEELQNEFSFSCRVQDTILIRKLTGADISIPKEAIVQGAMSDDIKRIIVSASVPELRYGGNVFKYTQLSTESNEDVMQASIKTGRVMKNNLVELGVNAFASNGAIRANLSWDNRKTPAQKGNINISGRILPDNAGRQGIESVFGKSDIVINDTAWAMSPGRISYHDKVLDINGVKVSSEDRHLTLDGRISGEETDTLVIGLKDISLSYIFSMINFHAIEFDGKATGRVYAKSLMGGPKADAFLQVRDFTFNNAFLGDMDIYGNYGGNGNSIALDAHIRDLHAGHQTSIAGHITPGKGGKGGLDLNIQTKRISLYFLNKYTSGIFTGFNGKASGWARVFGPFKGINIEGDLLAEDTRLHVNSLGTDYRLDGDSIILRPDNIWIRNATIYDHLGGKGRGGHSGRLNGHLMHEHLGHLRYDFSIEADNMMCYNTSAATGENFYGTAYATGDIRIQGEPGSVNVDVHGTPESGTTMVYNVTSPDAITEAGFITYVSKKDSTGTEAAAGDDAPAPTTDIRIDMDLNITPRATMKLIMDPRTGDHINLYGNAHILAKYYNKGKFQMLGTYRVDHGVYKLSMQDVIHKDFQFRPDGMIVFGGDPYLATLNLQATYTVPNVSLDDLSYTGLGLSNTRVDCLMNIGGSPKAPVITFDFDLPNANEDEKQMVRSMVSTDEEKNMQVIYLLGIGRFYSYGAQYMARGNRQGEVAMNSLISSTLSSQFNQIISSAMGNNNWTFGTNLRTGEEGWNQLDVEGMLSGRLLDNRLLLNGNFGYRESYYNNNNFIGDFDIQYVLNKARTLSLKAYNQTNDRYFIQSSLTTQGIGLKFQHDFNSWKEAFRSQRKKRGKGK